MWKKRLCWSLNHQQHLTEYNQQRWYCTNMMAPANYGTSYANNSEDVLQAQQKPIYSMFIEQPRKAATLAL